MIKKKSVVWLELYVVKIADCTHELCRGICHMLVYTES